MCAFFLVESQKSKVESNERGKGERGIEKWDEMLNVPEQYADEPNKN